MDLNERLDLLEGKIERFESTLEKVGMAALGEDASSQTEDVLQGRKALAAGTAVRIANVKLIYPRLSLEKQEEGYDPSTILVVEKDPEIISAIQTAYTNAYQYAFAEGRVKSSLETIQKNKPNESVFMTIQDLAKNDPARLKNLSELVGNGMIVRGAKCQMEDGKIISRYKDRNGKDLDGSLLRTGDVGEAVIVFYAYNFKGREGITKYFQGFIKDESTGSSDSRSIFI